MPARTTLPLPHILLALAVMLVWGANFVVVKIALVHLPPLLFAALRFMLAFLPAAFFVRRPTAPWRHLAAYGLLIGAGQFGLLFYAMKHDISPGLASLVIQVQVFFTIGLSVWFAKERVAPYQGLALVCAAAGVAVIVAHAGGDVTLLGLLFTIGAALCWALGNLVAKIDAAPDMLGYVVWSSIFAVPPLVAAALLVEGWPAMATGLRDASALSWAAVLYQSFGNTLFGYGSWAWLLARYPAATVSPFALLVPVIGMSTAALVVGEPLQAWKLLAAALVLGGLALNLAWPRLKALWSRA